MSDTNTGSYVIYGQRTNSSFGPSPMVWGGTALSGSITSATQNKTYTFGGTANNSISLMYILYSCKYYLIGMGDDAICMAEQYHPFINGIPSINIK